jgi:osmoprotectant transport system substrate-binding protein
MARSRASRVGLLAAAALLLLTAACGGSGSSEGKVVIVGQSFDEADVMTQLYRGVLEDAGFDTEVKKLGARDLYLGPLSKGDVMVSADYLSSMTEALNRKQNGDDAPKVASADVEATLAKLTDLAAKEGLTPLTPARAEDANAFAVTKAFAEQQHLSTLSDLGALGQPMRLGGNSDCPDRADCQKGLETVYGIRISKFEPTGFDSPATKDDLVKGVTDIGSVGTTDPTLEEQGLVILEDDKHLQNAENLVPIVNTKWLHEHPKARQALNALSEKLTTEDLTALLRKVSVEHQRAEDVADDYLKAKGLVG